MEIRDFGLWDSPITSEMLTTSGPRFGSVRYDADELYWTEQRPWDKGRTALCRMKGGATEDVTPAEYNIRSRVHEYGGIAFAVRHGRVVFTNFEDQCLYLMDGEDTRRLTEPGTKFAEPIFSGDRLSGDRLSGDRLSGDRLSSDMLIAVAEVEEQPEPRNFLSAISQTTGEVSVLDQGADFYASPAVSGDGSRIAWLTWNHPNMPWHGTELWVADLSDAGIGNRRKICGGQGESVFQPQWMESGELLFSLDRDGWWNLHAWDGDGIRSVHKVAAEFGLPQWLFGMSTTAACGECIAAAYAEDGMWRLALLDPVNGDLEEQDLPFTAITQVRSNGSVVTFIAASPEHASSLVTLDPRGGTWEIIKTGAAVDLPEGCISAGQPISFPTGVGATAHAFYYPPKNGRFEGPPDRLPPLIVKSHGGPTGAAGHGLSLGILYWTSRGFAVVDVNYRGSTGFGSRYRKSLDAQWGIVDVEDCCAAARHLVEKKMVDSERLAITGGSAGGYTTLACLAFEDLFTVGASYYGVSDLGALARDTHKFESRYLDSLIGPWPEAEDIFDARSPLLHADGLSCPVIFFQGLEDKVVPPNQAEKMVCALREKGLDVEYVAYPGEQHGFRMAETIRDSIEKERAFYLKTWDMI